MRAIAQLFFISTLIFSFESSYADQKKKVVWKEASRNGGIIIYTADADAESGIVPIRFRTMLPYSIGKVLAVLDDSENKLKWVPSMRESQTIERKSILEKIEFTRYASPWPFKDRTFLIHSLAKIDLKGKEVLIEVNSIDDKRRPRIDDYVRAETKMGEVFVRQLAPGRTVLEMSFLTDFKGNIPSWIINLVQNKWPHKMVASLKKRLEKQDIVIPKEFMELQGK